MALGPKKTKYLPSNEELEYLGFRLLSPESSPNEGLLDIERILFKLCLHLEYDGFDGRLAGTLVSWIKIHGDRVFVDRLRRMRERFVSQHGCDVNWLRYLAYYCKALKRHNWAPLTKSLLATDGQQNFYLAKDERLAKALLARWGLETFIPHNSSLKIHRGALRIRDEDVVDSVTLIRRNIQYANRYLYGVNVRADVASYLGSGQFLTVKELSEFLGLSREAVRKNWEDFKTFRSVHGETTKL